MSDSTKIIYVLFSCDIWKSSSSMSLVTATLSLEKLVSIIRNQIAENDMNYTNGYDSLTYEEQTQLFEQDVDNYGYDYAFDKLEYGYIEAITDGDVL